MSEEEKRLQIVRFLSQKREQFSINILCNLCRVLPDDATSAQAKAMVSLSVEMADKLMQKLYPMEREKEDGNG